MRLLALAAGIVVGFGLGAWGISRLLPQAAAQWLGIPLSMMWLFLLIFIVTRMSSKRPNIVEDQRRLFAYGLLAAVLMSSFLVPIFVYKLTFPRWAAECALAAIAGAVFVFSKYMEHVCRVGSRKRNGGAPSPAVPQIKSPDGPITR